MKSAKLLWSDHQQAQEMGIVGRRRRKKKNNLKGFSCEKAEALLWCISVQPFEWIQDPSFCWQTRVSFCPETSRPQQEGFKLCMHAKAAWGLMGEQTGQSKPATRVNLRKSFLSLSLLTAKPMGQLESTEGQSLRFVSVSAFSDSMNKRKIKINK